MGPRRRSSENCLLCYSLDSKKLTGRSKFFETSGHLLQQINEVFVLRNILGITKSYCSKLIQNEGSPSSWGTTYCSRCSNLIEEAQFISERIQHFQQKLNKLSKQIRLRLFQKIEVSKKLTTTKNDNKSRIIDKIRIEFSKNFNDIAQLPETSPPGVNSKNIESFVTPTQFEGCNESFSNEGEDEEYSEKLDIDKTNIKIENNVEVHTHEDEINNEKNLNGYSGNEDSPGSVWDGESEDYDEDDVSSNYEPSKSSLSRQRKSCNTGRTQSASGDETLKTVKTDKIVIVNKSKYLDPNDNISELDAEKRLKLFEEVAAANMKVIQKENFEIMHENTKFKCRLCGHTFRTEVSLEAHEKRVHFGIKYSFECKVCKKGFKNRWLLEAHLKTHLPNQKYFYCPECSRCRFTSEIKRDAHVQKVHRGVKKPYMCSECGRNFQRPALFEIHLKNVHNIVLTEPLVSEKRKELYRKKKESGWKKTKTSIRIRCTVPKCKRSFESELGLKAHIKSFHQGVERPYACDFCPSTFKRPSILQFHLKLHENEFVREQEEETFPGEESLKSDDDENYSKGVKEKSNEQKDEINSKHQEKNESNSKHQEEKKMSSEGQQKSVPAELLVYKCEECNKVFKHKASFLGHMKSAPHLQGSKPYMCEICCKTFLSSTWLANHQRMEHYEALGLDPIVCKECGKVYSQERHLEWHIQSKHKKEFTFKCTLCPNGYRYEHLLADHMRTHTGEKPFKCSMCDKGFTKKIRLDHHMRVHTGEKPYKCEHCDKMFADHSTYRRHLGTHKGILHTCPVCSKQFPIRHTLRVHMNRHEKEKNRDKEKDNGEKSSYGLRPKKKNNCPEASISETVFPNNAIMQSQPDALIPQTDSNTFNQDCDEMPSLLMQI